jgi:hypothetical protein
VQEAWRGCCAFISCSNGSICRTRQSRRRSTIPWRCSVLSGSTLAASRCPDETTVCNTHSSRVSSRPVQKSHASPDLLNRALARFPHWREERAPYPAVTASARSVPWRSAPRSVCQRHPAVSRECYRPSEKTADGMPPILPGSCGPRSRLQLPPRLRTYLPLLVMFPVQPPQRQTSRLPTPRCGRSPQREGVFFLPYK